MKKFFLGVKAIIIDSGKVLLLERNMKNPIWEAPGGRVDSDETIEETLIRELKEELPEISDITIHEKLGSSREMIELEKDVGLILFFYKVTAKLPTPLKLSDEHKNYLWVDSSNSLPELPSKELHRIVTSIQSEVLI